MLDIINNYINSGLHHRHFSIFRYSLIFQQVEKTGDGVLGASPDGLVEPDACLEIKCSWTLKDKSIAVHIKDHHEMMQGKPKDTFRNGEDIPYLRGSSSHIEINRNHQYFYQIQGQLYITGFTNSGP